MMKEIGRTIHDLAMFRAVFAGWDFGGSDPARSSSGITAVQELGFRLEPAKEPLDVVVIDSVEKPSEN